MKRSAIISDDGQYRYLLNRRWSTDKLLRWIMLNPSSADGERDTPTIEKCMYFADQEGYGAIVVANLYALRSPNPRELKRHGNPIGPKNNFVLATMSDRAKNFGAPIVVAWGGLAPLDRVREVYENYLTGIELLCLGLTTKNAPKHPRSVAENYQGMEPWRL